MEDLMGKIQEVLSDEESMKQLSELAQMFASSGEENSSDDNSGQQTDNNSSDGFDFSKLMMLQGLVGGVGSDKNTELLLALRPHLSKERQDKIDKAIKMLKLLAIWNVLKESGMLKDFL